MKRNLKFLGGGGSVKRLFSGFLTISLLVGVNSMSAVSAYAAETPFFASEGTDVAREETTENEFLEAEYRSENETSIPIEEKNDEAYIAERDLESAATVIAEETQDEESITSIDDTIEPDQANENKLGDNVYYHFEDEGKTLVISGSGKMWDYKRSWDMDSRKYTVNNPDFNGITKAVIEKNVTSIGAYLFFRNQTLETVEMSSSVKNLNASAFSGCTNLEKFTLPDTLTEIGSSAFSGCTNLKEISIPDTLASVGSSVFEETGVKEIIWPDNLNSIPSSAFSGCTNLEKITFPDTLTEIGSYAFEGCTNLEKISFPDSISSIGDFAFCDCPIGEIKFPTGLTYLGTRAFSGSKVKEIIWPDNLNSYQGAFADCTCLEKISLPDTLTEISLGGFFGCTNLKRIILPDSLSSIGARVFGECSFETVSIPALSYVGGEIFGCFHPMHNHNMSYGDVIFREGWKELYSNESDIMPPLFFHSDIDCVYFPQSLETLGAANNAKIFEDCNIKMVVFNGKTKRDPRCKKFVVPGKKILFPGTEREWKATGFSTEKGAKVYFNASTVNVTLISGEETARSILMIRGEVLSDLPEPYREDVMRIFDGWYLDEALTQPVVIGETKADSDITLYAKWREAEKCHSKFYMQDGSGEWQLVEEQELYEGQNTTSPVLTLPEGYKFWDYYQDNTFNHLYNLETPLRGDANVYIRTGKLSYWKGSATLKSGKELKVSLGYTDSVDFDGRKHVLAWNPAKGTEVKPTASQNPDIEIEAFAVYLEGKKLDGITMKSCSYKQQTGEIQLIPAVAYNSKDAELNQLLKTEKDLKTSLGKLLNPTYNKSEDEWSTDPIEVSVDEIKLSKDTEIYNLKGMSKAEKDALAEKDGILVWNGTGEKITWKTYKVKGEEIAWNDDGDPVKWGPSITRSIPVKVELPGLYYQRIFDLGNNKTATKKIPLRAGGWTTQKTSNDGEFEMIPSAGECDYYCINPSTEGFEPNEKPTQIELVVNDNGREYEKLNRVKYNEDGEVYYDYEIIETVSYKSGHFTGTIPVFGENKEVLK